MRFILENVCSFINGGSWSQDEYVETGIPVLKVSNLQLNSIDFSDISYLGFDSLHKYEKHKLIQHDIVIATVGSHPGLINSAAGRVIIIPKVVEGYLLNQNAVCLRVARKDLIDQSYLAYLCKTEEFKNYIQQRGKGAANQMRIAIEAIKHFEFDFPPLSIQQRIAEILGRYDALIENYQKQISALESMAQELYREWFVRGRYPYAQAGEAGWLPVGWEKVKLGDLLELKYGKSLVEEKRIPGPYPVLGSSGIINSHSEYLVGREGIVLGRKGNVGSVFWVDKPFYVIDTAYFVESKISHFYLYYNLQTQNFINGDAAVPGLNREQALNNEAIKPSSEALENFDKIIRPIFKKRSNLQSQLTILRETRDALLPKLLSGQLAVTEVIEESIKE